MVASDVSHLWDFDADGDWSEAIEDITPYVLSWGFTVGRDYPSLVQGRSAPGQLEVLLNNEDGRFNFYNAASPYNAGNLSLQGGVKYRVKATEAGNPDPTLLAFDRFNGSGVLTTAELGGAWTNRRGQNFVQTGGEAQVAAIDGTSSITTVDCGQNSHFVQSVTGWIDTANKSGVAFSITNSTNWAIVRARPGSVEVRKQIAGVSTTIAQFATEDRSFVAVGAYWNSATRDLEVYLDGVLLGTVTTGLEDLPLTSNCGLYASWEGQRPAGASELYVWDEPQGTEDGILFTGRVKNVLPEESRDHRKLVNLTVDGFLLTAARTTVRRPPASVGGASTGNLSTAGQMVGNALHKVGLLRPGAVIDPGIPVGAVALNPARGLTHMRRMERAEIGLIHETPEGPIGFRGRFADVGQTSALTFSDAGTDLTYERIKLLDWGNEIVNDVQARIAPKGPSFEFGTLGAGAAVAGSQFNIDVAIQPPGQGAVAGMLALVVITTTIRTEGVFWETPKGWTALVDPLDDLGPRVFAKKLIDSDFGQSYRFYSDTGFSGGSQIVRVSYLDNWYGSVQSGVQVVGPVGLGPPGSTTEARNGTNDPPVILPQWGVSPTMYLTYRFGYVASLAAGSIVAPDESTIPNGYANETSFYQAGASGETFNDAADNQAIRIAVSGVEDPSPWLSQFLNFDNVDTMTVAVRGFAGDPPETSGGQVVRSEDLDSQLDKGAVLSLPNPGDVFPDEGAALDYGAQILQATSTDKPLVEIEWTANRSTAHRNAAKSIRVGQRVTLEANGPTSQGIDGDFVVANVKMMGDKGNTRWRVVVQLGTPVDVSAQSIVIGTAAETDTANPLDGTSSSPQRIDTADLDIMRDAADPATWARFRPEGSQTIIAGNRFQDDNQADNLMLGDGFGLTWDGANTSVNSFAMEDLGTARIGPKVHVDPISSNAIAVIEYAGTFFLDGSYDESQEQGSGYNPSLNVPPSDAIWFDGCPRNQISYLESSLLMKVGDSGGGGARPADVIRCVFSFPREAWHAADDFTTGPLELHEPTGTKTSPFLCQIRLGELRIFSRDSATLLNPGDPTPPTATQIGTYVLPTTIGQWSTVILDFRVDPVAAGGTGYFDGYAVDGVTGVLTQFASVGNTWGYAFNTVDPDLNDEFYIQAEQLYQIHRFTPGPTDNWEPIGGNVRRAKYPYFALARGTTNTIDDYANHARNFLLL